MRYGSVCSGIEAASKAWEPLGWSPAWFAEIEPFPSAVLAYHWPQVPNLGDMTEIHHGIASGDIEPPDVLVGGTPCQAFSVAGLRSSLDDARGQLTLHFVGLANAIDNARQSVGLPPSIVVWENVPGVLTTRDNAFGCFLGALAGEDVAIEPPGGKWTNAGVVVGPTRTIAWRVLDAQYFGVAQRRRRVFVVASARDGFCPDEVLFEFEGVRRDSPPSREAGQDFARVAGTLAANGGGLTRPAGNCNELDFCVPVAPTIPSRSSAGGGLGTDFDLDGGLIQAFGGNRTSGPIDVAPALNACGPASGRQDFESETFVAFSSKDYGGDAVEGIAPTMRSMGHNESHANGGGQLAVAVAPRGRDGGATAEVGDAAAFTLRASTGGGDKPHALVGMQVRRLTPTECERLQGFPDGHTRIPWRGKPAEDCPDGPRYKALGNSMCVAVMRWIGERIQREVSK